mmetsp:Transcript_136068/g.435272  ORF Transcript_136068/g.435272 Transcript_136068/m.435272 type:complete len:277 (-) Transcript_136068:698-1528(-)
MAGIPCDSLLFSTRKLAFDEARLEALGDICGQLLHLSLCLVAQHAEVADVHQYARRLRQDFWSDVLTLQVLPGLVVPRISGVRELRDGVLASLHHLQEGTQCRKFLLCSSAIILHDAHLEGVVYRTYELVRLWNEDHALRRPFAAKFFKLGRSATRQVVVHGVVVVNALLHDIDLGHHQRRLQVRHAHRLIRDGALVLEAHVLRGCQLLVFPPQLLVTAGREDEEGLHLVIVGEDHAAFACVHELVGLTGDRRHHPEGATHPAVERAPVAVGRVLQ